MDKVIEELIKYDEFTDLKYIEAGVWLDFISVPENTYIVSELSNRDLQSLTRMLANDAIGGAIVMIKEDYQNLIIYLHNLRGNIEMATTLSKIAAEKSEEYKPSLELQCHVYRRIKNTLDTYERLEEVYYQDYKNYVAGEKSYYSHVWRVKSLYEICDYKEDPVDDLMNREKIDDLISKARKAFKLNDEE